MAKLTWEQVLSDHYAHNREGLVSFDACQKESCLTLKKVMPKHHWHGPDFGPGEGCCGCGADREEVSRVGNEDHCLDDRVVPVK